MTTTDPTTQLVYPQMSSTVYSTGDNMEYHSAQWDTGLPTYDKQTTAPTGEDEMVKTSSEFDKNQSSKAVASKELHSFGMTNDEVLRIEVINPEKHGEGVKDSYITYETMLESFNSPQNSVKRRYNDFVWLKRRLQEEYPACILPPLPEKQRLGNENAYLDYLDRFNPEFIAKRQVALNRFVEHLAIHPIIQKSDVLRAFLETPYLPIENAKKDSIMDNLSDAVLNAFSKLQNPDEKFLQMKSNVSILDDHLRVLDRIASKILQDERNVSLKLAEAGLRYQELNEESPELSGNIEKFTEVLKIGSEEMDRLAAKQETGLFVLLKEYIQYCRNAKVTLKSRDQRQLDYEDLSEFLKNHVAEREKIASLRPGQTANFSGFIHKKIDDMKGVDQVRAKQSKLVKLDGKIKDLQQEVNASKEISQSFDAHLTKEFQFFESIKVKDFKKNLLDASKAHHEYHKTMYETWKNLLEQVE